MKALWQLLLMYLPVAFLAALALFSFWLSPPPEEEKQPTFTTALEQARYLRLDRKGVLQVHAVRMEQTAVNRVDLQRPQLTKMADNSQIILRGDTGYALYDDKRMSVFFNHVNGVIQHSASDITAITLRATTVLYDADSGALTGKQPIFQERLGLLRGDTFHWDAAEGLKVQGHVESIYYR